MKTKRIPKHSEAGVKINQLQKENMDLNKQLSENQGSVKKILIQFKDVLKNIKSLNESNTYSNPKAMQSKITEICDDNIDKIEKQLIDILIKKESSIKKRTDRQF